MNDVLIDNVIVRALQHTVGARTSKRGPDAGNMDRTAKLL
jgi:hypothetical protein